MAATGLRQRHGLNCKGGRCACPREASVYSKADLKKIRQTFPTRALAVEWQESARPKVRKGAMGAPTAQTLCEASDAWLQGARSGLIRNSSGDTYKPSAIRTYDQALRLRVLPALGSRRLGDISRTDVQDLADKLLADGLNPSTISVTMLPVRAIYRRAIRRPESGIVVNPTSGLELPRVRGGRDRIASPDECSRLLAALDRADRPLWATAMFAGLRRGELQALRIEDVDLAAGVIDVHRGWDPKAGEIETKARNRRKVPIAAVLRDYLDEHLLGLDWQEGLVFGSTAADPFPTVPFVERAKRAWKAAKLDAISPHECRHTFASLMIAAGVNAKALSTYTGHANIGITLDKYGHLMPGNEAEAAGLLDAYLERSDTGARLAQLSTTGANPGASNAPTA
jgi:integrase